MSQEAGNTTESTATSLALIGAADRALYAAKESGRNRVAHVNSLPADVSHPVS